uniref:Uncharacterized protein n=1 Tax=Oryza rufipogon TaxID=4529 RepID=A0A0E0MV10_ORYRU
MAAAPNFVVGVGGRGGQICRQAPARLPPPSSRASSPVELPRIVPYRPAPSQIDCRQLVRRQARPPPSPPPSSSSAVEPSAAESSAVESFAASAGRRSPFFRGCWGGGGRGGWCAGEAKPRRSSDGRRRRRLAARPQIHDALRERGEGRYSGVAVPRGAAARSWQEQRRCPHKTSATNTLSPRYATRCGEGGGWSGGEVASDDGVRSWGKEEDKATEEKTVTLRIESGGKVFFSLERERPLIFSLVKN